MTNISSSSRNVSLDLIKILGLFGIILAHTFPPIWIDTIRSFDVPLMVILSGYVFHLTYQKTQKNFSYIAYLIKRAMRLLVPTWIFLSLFFGGWYILDVYNYSIFPFSHQEIMNSYLLWTGIGYVWIIRIYLFIALFGPFFVWILSKIRFKYTVLAFLFVGYEFLWFWFTKNYTGEHKEFITRGIFFLIPYLLLFLYGVFFRQQSIVKKCLMIVGLLCFFLFQHYAQFGGIDQMIHLQAYKYPARDAYIVYGLLVSSLLLLLAEGCKNFSYGYIKKPILWIGRSSLTLYLAHIPFVVYFSKYAPDTHWQDQFLTALFGAIIVTFFVQGCIFFMLKFFRICGRCISF